MKKIVKGLHQLDMELDVILTSPYVRAQETAQIVADTFGIADRLAADTRLAPGFGDKQLAKVLRNHDDCKTLVLVGHEPDFSSVISALTGGFVKMSKAGVALIDIDPETEKGRLFWLFPPKFARKAK